MILKLKFIKYIIFFYFIVQFSAYSEIVKKVEVFGNERISSDTIIMFADVKINQNIDDIKLNEIIKNLYDTNFFKNISAKINSNILQLNVVEFPIIENVNINGIKSNKLKETLNQELILKARSSFDEFLFIQEKKN